jgi:tRNA pseudouridine55 synthase
MNGRNLELDGVLLVDKARGVTSHDVIAKLRKIFAMRRIGHAGTLDPMATGLLIVLIGRSTKISRHMAELPKCYSGTMKLGIATDSHDSEGTVVSVREPGNITRHAIENLAESFLGDQYQIPPMFSAKKVNGSKLYRLARKGKVVERSPHFIRIDAFDVHALRGDEVDFSVRCSKGTYVRTLVNDFGERLGCGAHLNALRRTNIEKFSLENALTVDEIEKMSPEEVEKFIIAAADAVPPRIVESGLWSPGTAAVDG